VSGAAYNRAERVIWTTFGLTILYGGRVSIDWENQLIGGRRHAVNNIPRGYAIVGGAADNRAERVVWTTLGLTILYGGGTPKGEIDRLAGDGTPRKIFAIGTPSCAVQLATSRNVSSGPRTDSQLDKAAVRTAFNDCGEKAKIGTPEIKFAMRTAP
jgi:hypothetical protein